MTESRMSANRALGCIIYWVIAMNFRLIHYSESVKGSGDCYKEENSVSQYRI